MKIHIVLQLGRTRAIFGKVFLYQGETGSVAMDQIVPMARWHEPDMYRS